MLRHRVNRINKQLRGQLGGDWRGIREEVEVLVVTLVHVADVKDAWKRVGSDNNIMIGMIIKFPFWLPQTTETHPAQL